MLCTKYYTNSADVEHPTFCCFLCGNKFFFPEHRVHKCTFSKRLQNHTIDLLRRDSLRTEKVAQFHICVLLNVESSLKYFWLLTRGNDFCYP